MCCAESWSAQHIQETLPLNARIINNRVERHHSLPLNAIFNDFSAERQSNPQWLYSVGILYAQHPWKTAILTICQFWRVLNIADASAVQRNNPGKSR
ncbi:hypothetical protein [Bifidobacterium rousetti]|uniref:hypothetical protein n=1 Tax=Bifidobacterium rousetti TaxID=2045439 RepID=UPI00123A9D7A|nr:hypothetical protein [Bifidobacterium rousetti]